MKLIYNVEESKGQTVLTAEGDKQVSKEGLIEMKNPVVIQTMVDSGLLSFRGDNDKNNIAKLVTKNQKGQWVLKSDYKEPIDDTPHSEEASESEDTEDEDEKSDEEESSEEESEEDEDEENKKDKDSDEADDKYTKEELEDLDLDDLREIAIEYEMDKKKAKKATGKVLIKYILEKQEEDEEDDNDE